MNYEDFTEVSALNCRTAYKEVSNGVSKSGEILFNTIWNTMVFWIAMRPMKLRFHFRIKNGSPPSNS